MQIKKTIPLLRQTGLTITSQQFLQNGYIGSIAHKGKEVNLSGEPFSSVVEENKVKQSARDTEADNKTAEAYFDNGTAPDEMGQFHYSLRDAGITDREILSSTLDWAAENEQE